MTIRKAARSQRKLKLAVGGVSGSGKTLGALKLAYGICGDYSKICVIDTEQNSADLYADLGEFSVLPLSNYSPAAYIAAIDEVIKSGFEVLIIDSITHEWNGPGGVLDIVDKSEGQRGGKFASGWRTATPLHDKFVSAVTSAPVHVIATMRKKDENAITIVIGKSVPQKVVLKNIQRDGTD